jgi:hypothetical protein
MCEEGNNAISLPGRHLDEEALGTEMPTASVNSPQERGGYNTGKYYNARGFSQIRATQ